jgi:hypothetical protein
MSQYSGEAKLRIYYPPEEATDFVFFKSTCFRAHFPQMSEILEEWFDRSAENCDRFVNISEVDKYSVTCTVCNRFESDCTSPEGPSIIKLLDAANIHDKL